MNRRTVLKLWFLTAALFPGVLSSSWTCGCVVDAVVLTHSKRAKKQRSCPTCEQSKKVREERERKERESRSEKERIEGLNGIKTLKDLLKACGKGYYLGDFNDEAAKSGKQITIQYLIDKVSDKCGQCNGTGKKGGQTCTTCNGSGTSLKKEIHKIIRTSEPNKDADSKKIVGKVKELKRMRDIKLIKDLPGLLKFCKKHEYADMLSDVKLDELVNGAYEAEYRSLRLRQIPETYAKVIMDLVEEYKIIHPEKNVSLVTDLEGLLKCCGMDKHFNTLAVVDLNDLVNGFYNAQDLIMELGSDEDVAIIMTKVKQYREVKGIPEPDQTNQNPLAGFGGDWDDLPAQDPGDRRRMRRRLITRPRSLAERLHEAEHNCRFY